MFKNHFKKVFNFRNQKCAANTNIFQKVAEKMNEKAAAGFRKNRITHSQIRNKFKKLVCEYKSISLISGQRVGLVVTKCKKAIEDGQISFSH